MKHITLIACLALAACDNPPKELPMQPCTVVTAKVFRWLGDQWHGPKEYRVCVISVDGKPYVKN